MRWENRVTRESVYDLTQESWSPTSPDDQADWELVSVVGDFAVTETQASGSGQNGNINTCNLLLFWKRPVEE